MTYQPKKGFLLSKQVKRVAPKSAFLKALERKQAKLTPSPAPTETELTNAALKAIGNAGLSARKLQLILGYKERRK